ncbi:MAG: hypothetical protein KKE86_15415, partial [Planctomycetes bacterium]|nr:hypothetical protein [Planctomycetota bacterium]
DGRSVYLARKALGEELARLETVPIDENTVVVPVPDTSKAAADSMAFALRIPCVEGLIRNRYSGRTFIEGSGDRRRKAETKYTPLREVLEGKRVLLVEDSIVRATTLEVLLQRIRQYGRPREIHVRVACPPIVSPCFYGIDMSTVGELFAPKFLGGKRGQAPFAGTALRVLSTKGACPLFPALRPEIEAPMAARLGADSLRYLPVEAISRAIGIKADNLCQACITGDYPTPCGQRLAQIALENFRNNVAGRTYETTGVRGEG